VKRPEQNAGPRTLRASLIRKRTEFLGHGEAPERNAAEVAAVEKLKLDDEQRKRLVLQQQPAG
jgi:hypothetical protein